MRDVDGHEARRQQIGGHVLVGLRRGPTRRALLRYRREAVVGRKDHVGVAIEAQLPKRIQQPRKVIVRVPDRGKRGRAVDARDKPSEAVALIVLRAVGIARPEYDDKRLLPFLEQRQHRLRCDVREEVLLLHVGDSRAGDCVGACLAVRAACGRLGRDLSRGQALLDFVGQRDAAGAAGHVVDNDGVLPGPLGVIEDQGGAELADGGRREAGLARRLEDGFLVQVVTREVLIDIAQHRIALQERRQAVARARHLEAHVNVVAEVAGIPKHVPRRHAGGVGRGECREQRMRIGEPDAARQKRCHRGRRMLVDHAWPQAVRHEQHDIVGAGLGNGRRGQDSKNGGRYDQRTHFNHSPRKVRGRG